MTDKVKTLILGGVGGAIGFAIVTAVITAAIKGTDSASVLFQTVVPISIVGGIATIIVLAAFA